MVAVANSELETHFWYGVASAAVVTALACYYCCATPCPPIGCAPSSKAAAFAAAGAAIATSLGIAQYFYFLKIKDEVDKGIVTAKKNAFYFSFINSGTSLRLKDVDDECKENCDKKADECEENCDEEDDECKENCDKEYYQCLVDKCIIGEGKCSSSDEECINRYQPAFSLWLKNNFGKDSESVGDSYTYRWREGNESTTEEERRKHSVTTKIEMIDNIKYDFKVSLGPWPAISAMYLAAAAMARSGLCCPACCAIVCATVAAAFAMFAPVRNVNCKETPNFTDILAWIITTCEPEENCRYEDIEGKCNKVKLIGMLIKVLTHQYHQGYEYGLWKAEYPEVNSCSIACYKGKGKIHPPDPHFDSTIIRTDAEDRK